MLFCFGLFALLLYYTVVANAECSYTFWNSSQHIEAQSSDYERQGFQRCEFIIQASGHNGVKLNFTRISGFGTRLLHEGLTEEEEEEDGGQEKTKEEESRGQRTGGKGGRGGGGGRAEASASALPPPPPRARGRGKERPRGRGNESAASDRAEYSEASEVEWTHGSGDSKESQGPRFVTSPSASSSNSSRSKLSSILSSPTPPIAVSSTVFVQSETLVEVSSSSPPPSKTPSPSPPLVHGAARPVHPKDNGSGRRQKHRPTCLPKVEIREVNGKGRDVICRDNDNYQTPAVFQYDTSVRIVYEWEANQNSGFTLYFDFSEERDVSGAEDCVLRCDSGRCVRDRQLCDGQYDCVDKSDERQPACHNQLQSPAAATGELDSGSLVKIIVIPTSLVVLILLSIVCLLGRHHCHALSRTMHHRHAGGHAGNLTSQPSHSSEGLTPSAGSTQECSEQAVALLPSGGGHHRHHQHSQHKKCHPHPHPSPPPPPRDAEIDLPPNIPVSPDGEEGYVASQVRLLHPRYCMVQSEVFKAPPNKTVFDRESPPPYSLSPSQKSVGSSSAPPVTSRSGFVGTGQGFVPVSGSVRVVRDSRGHPVVSRCYTMFTQPTRSPGGLGEQGATAKNSGGRGGGRVGDKSASAGVRDSGSSPRHRRDQQQQQQHRYSQQQQQQCHQQRQQLRPQHPPPPLSPPYRGACNVVNNTDGFHPIPAPTPTPITPSLVTPAAPPILVFPSVSAVERRDTQDQNSPPGHSPSRGRGGVGGGHNASQGNSCDRRGSPPPAYNELTFTDSSVHVANNNNINIGNNSGSTAGRAFGDNSDSVAHAFGDATAASATSAVGLAFGDSANSAFSETGNAGGRSFSEKSNAGARAFSETSNNAAGRAFTETSNAFGETSGNTGQRAFSDTSNAGGRAYSESSNAGVRALSETSNNTAGFAFSETSNDVSLNANSAAFPGAFVSRAFSDNSSVEVAFADSANANSMSGDTAYSDSTNGSNSSTPGGTSRVGNGLRQGSVGGGV